MPAGEKLVAMDLPCSNPLVGIGIGIGIGRGFLLIVELLGC